MEYFYSLDVVYRDLKCENILLDCNKNILILDFGFVRIQFMEYDIGKRRLSMMFCGFYVYVLFEIFCGIVYDGICLDVWSLGVVLFIMLCVKLFYDDLNFRLLMEQVIGVELFYN